MVTKAAEKFISILERGSVSSDAPTFHNFSAGASDKSSAPLPKKDNFEMADNSKRLSGIDGRKKLVSRAFSSIEKLLKG